MIVHVHNQQQVCALTPIADTVVISITNPAQAAALQEGWEAVLRVKFLTGTIQPKPDPPRKNFPGWKPKHQPCFNEGIAREIDGFCLAHHNKDFVVHCYAGLHRSIAVAAYIQDVFGAEMVRHVPSDGWDYENDSMYQMMMKPYEGIFPCK
jgi:predicted protein tyrosine phosphatase